MKTSIELSHRSLNEPQVHKLDPDTYDLFELNLRIKKRFSCLFDHFLSAVFFVYSQQEKFILYEKDIQSRKVSDKITSIVTVKLPKM